MGSGRFSEELSQLDISLDFEVFCNVSSRLSVQSPGKHKLGTLWAHIVAGKAQQFESG